MCSETTWRYTGRQRGVSAALIRNALVIQDSRERSAGPILSRETRGHAARRDVGGTRIALTVDQRTNALARIGRGVVRCGGGPRQRED
jgi:hypothetical protein